MINYNTSCTILFTSFKLFLPVCAIDNAPLGVGTFFGGVVAGVVSVVLFEVCVLGVVKWRRRMKEPAASKEKEGIRFVSMIIITMQGNVLLMHEINQHVTLLSFVVLCRVSETPRMSLWTLLIYEPVAMEMNPSYTVVSMERSLKN